MRRTDLAYLAASAAFAAVGLLAAPTTGPVPRTMVALLLLFALPLAAFPTRRSWLMVPAFWLAAFLALQTLASRLVLDPDQRTLPPGLDIVVDVRSGIPGIEGPQHVTTDARGFRVLPPVDYATTGALRVFAIGGSTTEDLYLDDRATWPYLLQERLRRRLGRPVEVVNTGVSGLRARHHLATLKEVEGLHPDLVLFLLGANDWNRQIFDACGYPPGMRRCLMPPCIDETLAGRAVSRLWGLLHASAIPADRTRVDNGEFFAARRASLSRPERCAFRPEAVSRDYAATLEAIARECDGAFGCALITQPNGYTEAADEDFRRGFWATPFDTPYTLSFADMGHIARLYNGFLASFAASHRLPLCDLAPAIPPSYAAFYDEMHFNTAGAALVAEALEPCVADVLVAAAKRKAGG